MTFINEYRLQYQNKTLMKEDSVYSVEHDSKPKTSQGFTQKIIVKECYINDD